MDTMDRYQKRKRLVKAHKAKVHLKEIASEAEARVFLGTNVDDGYLQSLDISATYVEVVRSFDLEVSGEEASQALAALGREVGPPNIIEPVFLSLIDGFMRAFKIGTKQGLTASRIFQECRSFTYEAPGIETTTDSFTEYLNEEDNIRRFDEKSNFNGGELIRDGEVPLNLRDGPKMGKMRDSRFTDGGATDDYNPNQALYQNKKHAKSKGEPESAAEVDHAISCHQIANELKGNKALNPEEIKEIINIDENLKLTSKGNNRGSKTGKFAKSAEELQLEVDQGYTVDARGRRHPLSGEDIRTRKNMVAEMSKAKKALDKKTNEKVTDNLLNDRKTQKRLSKDALNAAGHQAVGEAVLAFIKPLYFELNDCIINGVELQLAPGDFQQSLKLRLERLKNHVMLTAKNTLQDGALNFFKNFLSMLLEGIVNCFVGVFKQVVRLMKEGVKVLMQIVPILLDKNASHQQKGDAIIKLFATSAVMFSSIGIEAWLNSLGIPDPWSIVLSSVMSSVLMILVLYLLDKIDLFNMQAQIKFQRLEELVRLETESIEEGLLSLGV